MKNQRTKILVQGSVRRWTALTAGFSIALALSMSLIGQGSAFAWSTPTTVTFTSTNYTVNAVSNWTFGFSLYSGTGLSNGNSIYATFPKGFTVPASPVVVLGSAFGLHYCKVGSITVTNSGSPTLAPTIAVRLAGTGQANNCAGTYWPGVTSWTVEGVTNPSVASSTVTGYTEYNTVEPVAGTVNSPVAITPTTPGPVSAFAATSYVNGKSVLTWSPPLNNGGSPITGYSITSSPVVSPPSSCTNTISLTCTFTGLSNGTQYTFTISPKNVAGNGTSATTTATPALAPTITSATINGSGQIGLPLYAGATGVTGAPSPATTYQWYANGAPINNAIDSSYMVQSGDFGKTITVQVTETNIAGKVSALSSPPVAVTGVVPGAPGDVTGTPVSGLPWGDGASVTVSWVPPTNGGLPLPILSYTVQYSLDDSHWSTATTDAGGTSFVVTGLVAGESYDFEVSANNAAGTGPATGTTTATTPYTVPETLLAPTDSVGNATLFVSWTPADDGGSTITGYDVLIDGTAYYIAGGSTSSATFTGTNGIGVINAGIANGNWYAPVVRAINASGASVYSAQANTVFPGFAPEAPTYVTATETSSTTANIYYPFAVTSSGNGGWELANYTVYVTLEGSPITDSVQTITTGWGNVHDVSVSGLEAGNTYVFTVVANAVNGTFSPPVSSSPLAIS